MWGGLASAGLAALLVLACCTPHAVGIKMDISEKECLLENVEKKQSPVVVGVLTMSKTMKTLFDVEVKDPAGNKLHVRYGMSDDEAEFVALEAGMHSFCFTISPRSPRASFASPQAVLIEIRIGHPKLHDMASSDHIFSLLDEVYELADYIEELSSEIRYMATRERRHRVTTENTQARVFWYAIAKAVVFVGLAVVQVFTIRYFFSDVLTNHKRRGMF